LRGARLLLPIVVGLAALVAFLACLMVAVAATSVATNLARVSR